MNVKSYELLAYKESPCGAMCAGDADTRRLNRFTQSRILNSSTDITDWTQIPRIIEKL